MATLFDIDGVTTRASPPSEPPSPALAPFGGDPFGVGPVGATGGGVGGPVVEAGEDASGLLVAPDGVGACVALLRRLGLEKHEAAVLHHELDVATLRDLAETDGLDELGITSKIEASKVRAALKKMAAAEAKASVGPAISNANAATANAAAHEGRAPAAISAGAAAGVAGAPYFQQNTSPYAHRIGMKMVNMSRDPKLESDYPPCLVPWRSAVSTEEWERFVDDTNEQLKKYRTNATDTALMGAAPLVVPMIPLIMRQNKREKKMKAVLESAAARWNADARARCGFTMRLDTKASSTHASTGELVLELAGDRGGPGQEASQEGAAAAVASASASGSGSSGMGGMGGIPPDHQARFTAGIAAGH
mmetsp:Transcript_5399/g.10982  ORF Transcript_5399/g.10982 Transcript_5399/m.10982 type:complete len:363 (-) Transcript_5399:66-1154(-)